ncbi:hypothetical protein vseg_010075 [Gypsophila vaccaria]
MCEDNQSIKTEINVHDRKFGPNHRWPEWLPQDWCIHQNIDDLGASSNVCYSNPKGKRFYSKDEVLQHIATHPSHINFNKQIGLVKSIKTRRSSKRNKLVAKDNRSSQINSPQKWPEWLPQDWCIKRSCDDPCNVYYCSPEWNKFRCKDEVIKHIIAKSLKPELNSKPQPKSEPEPEPEREREREPESKQIRKRKYTKAKNDDQVVLGTKRRRKGKNDVTY